MICKYFPILCVAFHFLDIFDSQQFFLFFMNVFTLKIIAMILNSTEFYTTSEKSARYTLMKPETEREAMLYEKWQKIFKEEIKLKINAKTFRCLDYDFSCQWQEFLNNKENTKMV